MLGPRIYDAVWGTSFSRAAGSPAERLCGCWGWGSGWDTCFDNVEHLHRTGEPHVPHTLPVSLVHRCCRGGVCVVAWRGNFVKAKVLSGGSSISEWSDALTYFLFGRRWYTTLFSFHGIALCLSVLPWLKLPLVALSAVGSVLLCCLWESIPFNLVQLVDLYKIFYSVFEHTFLYLSLSLVEEMRHYTQTRQAAQSPQKFIRNIFL